MIIHYIKLFFSEMITFFFEMAPYIMLGIGIAGLLHVILSKDFVARHIGGRSISSIFKASLFGVPLPLCSCGVVPTAVYLKNSGASKSAVTSFLISTPQTGVDSITASWGVLGPVFAIFKAVAALFIGMAGGIADFLLDRPSKINGETKDIVVETHDHHGHVHSSAKSANIEEYPGFFGKIREMFNYAVFELLDDIALNFVAGLVIAAVISIAIPDDFFSSSILSNPLLGMIIMVVIGIPMYICSTSSIPIAVALIAKGVSPGAAYVFLVAGPATNAASLAIIGKALGKKTTIIYLASIIAGSLIFGIVMDFTYRTMGITAFGAAADLHHAEEAVTPFVFGVSITFLLLLIILFIRRIRVKLGGKVQTCECGSDENCKTGASSDLKESPMTKINIEGMTCSHCTANVEKALSTVSGITKINMSLENKCTYIEGDFMVDEAETAIENAGYIVTGLNNDAQRE